MDAHSSWFALLPGYAQIEAYFRSLQPGGGKGLLGLEYLIIQPVLAAILVIFVVLLVSWRARTQLQRVGADAVIPDAKISIRNMLEVVFEALYGQMKDIIGADAGRYFPVIGTLAMFIFFSNIMGLIPGFSPPTNNWNTTFACGGFVFLYYNWHGMRVNGWRHLAHMANPTGESWGWFLAPLMLPIEIVSHIARPFSLGVRLATNMIGDHAVLVAFLGLMPVLVPLPFLALGLLVSLIQTFVFVLLSMIYIGLAVEEMHHHDEKSEKHATEGMDDSLKVLA